MDRQQTGQGNPNTTMKIKNQQLFEYMMFAGIAVGIVLSTWTTHQQRNSTSETSSKNLLVVI